LTNGLIPELNSITYRNIRKAQGSLENKVKKKQNTPNIKLLMGTAETEIICLNNEFGEYFNQK
jgi:hypothetical protein